MRKRRGTVGGNGVGRRRAGVCGLAFALGMLLLMAVVVSARTPSGERASLCLWLTAYRREYVASGLGTALVVGALVALVPTRRLRVLLLTLGLVAVVRVFVLPFGAPMFLRGRHAALRTTLTAEGVCLQSNGYTCGPACVVTALRLVGVSAEEGEVAIATHANPFSGTQEEDMRDYISDAGRQVGITAELVPFASPEDLPEPPVILPVKYSLLVNHYVVYLGREDGAFVIADPLEGRERWSPRRLERRWWRAGIVVRKGR